MKRFLSRRTVLRGAGVSLALPVLDGMLTPAGLLRNPARAAGNPFPTRVFTWAFGNGTRMNRWNPSAGEGALTAGVLSQALSPLGEMGGDLTSDVAVVTGLNHKQTVLAGAHDGVFIFSGGPNVKSSLSAFPLPGGPSVDTVLAAKLGTSTRLQSLAVSNDKNDLINWSILSWGPTGQPITPYRSPRALFDKLFAGAGSTPKSVGGQDLAARSTQREKSLLDFIKADAEGLKRELSPYDRARIDEHLAAIREVEKQLLRVDPPSGSPFAGAACDKPNAVAAVDETDFVTRGRVLMNLFVLALKCDLTRFGTFNYQNSDANQKWPGVSEADHTSSHESSDDVVSKITQLKMQEFAFMLRLMKSIPEGAGTLLDHSLVLCSSEIGQGNSHSTTDLPVIIAGRGGGFKPGRLLKRAGSNYNDMLCSMINYAGVPTDKFGMEGNGPLSGL